MSTLKSRLDTLRRQGGSGSPPRGQSIEQRLQRLRCGGGPPRRGREPDPDALAAAVGGRAEPNGYVVVEHHLPWGSVHGKATLEPPQTIAHLPQVDGVAPDRWLFLDTETSGLAGGTGTVAFLGGLARLGARGLDIRQYLLGAFGAEPAMLRAMAAELEGRPSLVTYNGKGFDLPLLRDRLRLHHLRREPEAADHLDLLHPVRRAFAARWPDCRLATLEARLLGYRRVDDLPGAEVPAVWFGYLHEGRTAGMADVVRHNRDDLIALALALPRLDAVYADPAAHGADVRQVAAAHSRAGRPGRALALLRAAAPALDHAGWLELAEHLRRRGAWQQACAIWEPLAEQGCPRALERLAKYHEHVRRDWRLALHYAHRLPDGAARGRRLTRLQAKLSA